MLETGNKFLVCLGTEGLESFLDLDAFGHDLTIAKLKGEPLPTDLNAMTLSHRINSHRRIKSYVVIVPMEAKEFRKELEENEYMRDLVREKGEEVRI